MSIFSERLRFTRESSGYSQKEFAKKLNLASNTYNGYETGNRMPNLEILTLLANTLDVSVDYLLGRTSIKSVFVKNIPSEYSNLIDKFDKLNELGKSEAIKRLEELSFVPSYSDEKES